MLARIAAVIWTVKESSALLGVDLIFWAPTRESPHLMMCFERASRWFQLRSTPNEQWRASARVETLSRWLFLDSLLSSHLGVDSADCRCDQKIAASFQWHRQWQQTIALQRCSSPPLGKLLCPRIQTGACRRHALTAGKAVSRGLALAPK
jgi:hypothetical protein